MAIKPNNTASSITGPNKVLHHKNIMIEGELTSVFGARKLKLKMSNQLCMMCIHLSWIDEWDHVAGKADRTDRPSKQKSTFTRDLALHQVQLREIHCSHLCVN